MNLSCSSRMIKYLMFGFNLFFVISGIIIIAVGAAVKTVYTEYAQFLDSQYFSLPNMLIATGALIFMVSFFGCCGAIKESWIMLGIFSILLCIIFIFEFASGIAGYVLRDKTASFLESTLTKNLETYNNTHQIWDLIQESFQCCGVNSYADWSGRLKNDTYALPISCCPARSGTISEFHCNSYNPPSTTSTETTIPITSSTSSSTTSSTTADTTTTTAPTASTSTTIASTTTTTASSTETSTYTTVVSDATTAASHPTKRRRRALNDSNNLESVTTNAPTPSGLSTSTPYATGCKSAFGDYIKKHAVQIGGCALGLAFIQILGIIFSCHLVRQLKNGYYST